MITLILGVLFLLLYFLTAIIADRRNEKNITAIVVLNLLAGWNGPLLDGSSLWCGHGHKIEAIESCAEGAMVWFGMVAKRIAMIRYGDEANSDGMVLSGRVQSSDSKVQYCEGMVQCRAAVVLLC